MAVSLSNATIQRLPIYLDYLKTVGSANISATAISAALGLGEVQVRKDLAAVCSSGKPKIGYDVRELTNTIEETLGYHNVNNAVLVGAGKLGLALLEYEGFQHVGLSILAAFDADSEKTGKTVSGKPIYEMAKLADFCKENKVRIGIVTVPAAYAEEICHTLIEAGILAIWNFAPVHLHLPEGIILKSENMASSLAVLSNALSEKLKEK